MSLICNLKTRLRIEDDLLSTIILAYKGKGKGEGKSCLCALTEHHAMKAYWGSGSIAPLIFDLSTRRR
jgi:hypothetical protein